MSLKRSSSLIFFTFIMPKFQKEIHDTIGKKLFLVKVNEPFGMIMYLMINFPRFLIPLKVFSKTVIAVHTLQLEVK